MRLHSMRSATGPQNLRGPARSWLPITRHFVLGLFLPAAISCTSSSLHNDVARVQDFTHAAALPTVVDSPVASAADPGIALLLRRPLDAEAAVRVALLTNRELRARLRELGVTRGQVLQAGLFPNPHAELELLPERTSELEIRVDYDITQAVLAPLHARALGPELERERYRVAEAVVDLAYRVRVGFLRVQANQQRLDIAQQALRGTAAAREAARAMFEAGNVPTLDLANQETAYEKSALEVERKRLDVAAERERFTRLLGLQDATPSWHVEAPLTAAPEHVALPDDLEIRSLRASLELQADRQHLESLARRAGYANAAGLIPDITLDVHALKSRPETDAGQHDWRFGGGVVVGLPLFDRQQGQVLEWQSSFDAQLERYYGRASELRSEARELKQRITSAHLRARRYQEVILPGQNRITEQTLLQYNAMQLGVFQVLAARRDQFDTELAYVETLREYWSDVAALEAMLQGRSVAMSGALDNALQTPMSSAEHGS